ncbi:receptor-like protein 47 [Eucalyptus grandis]|uniref:receptor-like protein 47 n=1 Tax=Eucalyptus grandis TaxID=71139 RepID=UPI00192E8C03|nr:receptor-like protein 47 [Eucalyptus grandis]
MDVHELFVQSFNGCELYPRELCSHPELQACAIGVLTATSNTSTERERERQAGRQTECVQRGEWACFVLMWWNVAFGETLVYAMVWQGQIPIELTRLRKLSILDLSLLYFPGLDTLKLKNPNLKTLTGNLTELIQLHLDGVDLSSEGNEWCDALSSSVQKLEVLSMSNCFLSGPVDSSLVNLHHLSFIQLNGNNLSATVPEFLARLPNLTTLHMSYCGLYGELPHKIFQLQTLQTLDLSLNQLLQGTLPDFPEDSSLETLVLSDTNISGRLPDSIGNPRKLSRLELFNCRLSGLIPSSIENLSRLTYLDLSLNNLTGSVPSFGMSKNLRQILLSHNALTGEIKSTPWEELLSLVNLDLRNNSLEGTIPPSLFILPSVKTIKMSNNQFSGDLSGSLNVTCCQLNVLDLSTNNLEGPIPAYVFELRGLKYLSLSSNNFSGSLHIDVFQRLKNLTYLDLSHNRLSINATSSTSALFGFPTLYTLKLASCKLSSLPEFLKNLPTLGHLDLSDNQIQGEIPKWIWEGDYISYVNLSFNFFEKLGEPLPNLPSSLSVIDLHRNKLQGKTLPLPPNGASLDFSSNNFSSVLPNDIGKHLALTIFFSLSNNYFHGPVPESICEAWFLEVLDLSNNHLMGTIPQCLKLETLKVLNLRNNNLTGGIPYTFPGTCLLRTLDVNGNLLTGKLPISLANCSMLEVLDVGNNWIKDVFPCQLKNISTLRILVLHSNKFYGQIGCPVTNGTWKMLQIVDLAFNDFSGMLPEDLLTSWEVMKVNSHFDHLQYPFLELSKLYYQDTVSVTFKGLQLELVKILTVFTLIDFSSNRLEGPIPEALGDLRALYFLNLSHNVLSGHIPPSLGKIQQLESLDLSQNFLNGTIPVQLSDLNFLSVLNLSYNQLVGMIPARKQFLTFSEGSFKGNGGLCGFPLDKSCPTTTNPEEADAVPTQRSKQRKGNGWIDMKPFYMSMPLGFVIGFWVFCGSLIYIQPWRHAYYQFWDDLLFRLSQCYHVH